MAADLQLLLLSQPGLAGKGQIVSTLFFSLGRYSEQELPPVYSEHAPATAVLFSTFECPHMAPMAPMARVSRKMLCDYTFELGLVCRL